MKRKIISIFMSLLMAGSLLAPVLSAHADDFDDWGTPRYYLLEKEADLARNVVGYKNWPSTFTLYNMNKDKTPELFFKPEGDVTKDYTVKLYGYYNQKVSHTKTLRHIYQLKTGGKTLYTHTQTADQTSYSAYRYQQGKLRRVCIYTYDKHTHLYTKNEKKISKTAYLTYKNHFDERKDLAITSKTREQEERKDSHPSIATDLAATGAENFFREEVNCEKVRYTLSRYDEKGNVHKVDSITVSRGSTPTKTTLGIFNVTDMQLAESEQDLLLSYSCKNNGDYDTVSVSELDPQDAPRVLPGFTLPKDFKSEDYRLTGYYLVRYNTHYVSRVTYYFGKSSEKPKKLATYTFKPVAYPGFNLPEISTYYPDDSIRFEDHEADHTVKVSWIPLTKEISSDDAKYYLYRYCIGYNYEDTSKNIYHCGKTTKPEATIAYEPGKNIFFKLWAVIEDDGEDKIVELKWGEPHYPGHEQADYINEALTAKIGALPSHEKREDYLQEKADELSLAQAAKGDVNASYTLYDPNGGTNPLLFFLPYGRYSYKDPLEVYDVQNGKVTLVKRFDNTTALKTYKHKLLVQTKTKSKTTMETYVWKNGTLQSTDSYCYNTKTGRYTHNGQAISPKRYQNYETLFFTRKHLDVCKLSYKALHFAETRSSVEFSLYDSTFSKIMWYHDIYASLRMTLYRYDNQREAKEVDHIEFRRNSKPTHATLGRFNILNLTMASNEVPIGTYSFTKGYESNTVDVTTLAPEEAGNILPGFTYPQGANLKDYVITGHYTHVFERKYMTRADYYLLKKGAKPVKLATYTFEPILYDLYEIPESDHSSHYTYEESVNWKRNKDNKNQLDFTWTEIPNTKYYYYRYCNNHHNNNNDQNTYLLGKTNTPSVSLPCKGRKPFYMEVWAIVEEDGVEKRIEMDYGEIKSTGKLYKYDGLEGDWDQMHWLP